MDSRESFKGSNEEYQVASKVDVSDNLRSAILVTRAPLARRNHVVLNASRDPNWTDMKRSAMDFLLATTFSPAPMDIGHVKGGKFYEGGKPLRRRQVQRRQRQGQGRLQRKRWQRQG